MSEEKCIVLGICGVTCGGKSTLANQLNRLIPQSILISQDDYFLDIGDSRHTYIPELNHINFDIITSLDMDKMFNDVLKQILHSKSDSIVKNVSNIMHINKSEENVNNIQELLCKKIKDCNTKIYIIEGFCIFNYKPLVDLFHLKYYFTLPKDICYKRRIARTYEPPDCPNYFEKCVWPEYLNLLNDVEQNVKNVRYLDGTIQPPLEDILHHIYSLL